MAEEEQRIAFRTNRFQGYNRCALSSYPFFDILFIYRIRSRHRAILQTASKKRSRHETISSKEDSLRGCESNAVPFVVPRPKKSSKFLRYTRNHWSVAYTR